MVKSEGESGAVVQSLVPRCSVKLRDVRPLVMTVAEGGLYRILIQLMNDSPKPNLSNVENVSVTYVTLVP